MVFGELTLANLSGMAIHELTRQPLANGFWRTDTLLNVWRMAEAKLHVGESMEKGI